MISSSHAAKYGAWAGLGITIALQSVNFTEFAAGSRYWQRHQELTSGIGFLIAFTGYIIFLFGLMSYHRIRNEAYARLRRSNRDLSVV